MRLGREGRLLRGRFSAGSASSEGIDVSRLIRELQSLSEQERERCMRAVENSAGSDVSSLEEEVPVEAGSPARVAPTLDDAVETPCFQNVWAG